MDPRNEIREFLVSRRARITPDHAGLTAYGTNRRVKGLRREEAAMLAGISVEYYVRLERGNVRGVSEDVLDGVTRALQLDEADRMHLFDLARAANASPARGASPPSPTTASACSVPKPVGTRTTSGSPTSSVSCRPAARSSDSGGRRTM
ncbi:MAG TPA: helix-turn-helix transcriptional regulator [Egibacteraceae bacterium]|jgi:hypothetical protein|nr:helix-turn-helix transcriptional regulator [Egibacteraceae bacterium]